MKKLALALVCLASVAFFASCNPEVTNPEPSIAVLAGENYVTGTVDNPTIIDVTDENAINLKYGFHVESNAQTKKELASLKITATATDETGTETYDTIIDLTGKTSYDFSEYLFRADERDIYLDVTFTALVTDADNKTNTATIAFKLDLPMQPLEETDFTWFRHGSNDGEGLEEFGLEWTNNGKEVFAIIKPVTGATLYQFTPDVWDEVLFDVEKAAIFENAFSITDFRGVSAWSSKDYDYVIGTEYMGEYHLIHITHGTVVGSGPTDITITGQAK
jgi:hypothetical protein